MSVPSKGTVSRKAQRQEKTQRRYHPTAEQFEEEMVQREAGETQRPLQVS